MTWANKDTRLNPNEFYERCLNHQIAIREMGGVEAFNDFAGSLSQLEELKQEERMREAITESKSLLSGNQIGRNSSGNLRIYGSLDDRIVKTLLWQK